MVAEVLLFVPSIKLITLQAIVRLHSLTHLVRHPNDLRRLLIPRHSQIVVIQSEHTLLLSHLWKQIRIKL